MICIRRIPQFGLACVMVLIIADTCRGQRVQISGTVLDPTGEPYQNGSGRAVLVPQNQQWLANGTNRVQSPIPINRLDSFGKFSVSLTNTTLISPASANPQWQFSFCSQSIQNQAPVCFTMTPMSLTRSQDISTQIQTQAGLLPVPGNVFGGANNILTGKDTFSGMLLCKNFEGLRCEDQFSGATPAARVSAALADCGVNPCTVVIPSSEASTEILGNLTTNPTTTQAILDLRNSGPGSTQATNWLLCDFSGTSSSSPCRNGGGAQAFQVGRTWNNSPSIGNTIATFWGRWTGVSANNLANPLDSLGVIAEMGGLTQSNGTPAPVIGVDSVASVTGNNTSIPNFRFFSTDPGGLNNAGTGNTITNAYGYYAQNCGSCVPAGLTITNWYNGYFNEPSASGVTNPYALWSNGRTVISDSMLLPSQPLLAVRGLLSGGSQRTSNVFQVADAASGDQIVFEIAQNGRTDFFQKSNGTTTTLMRRFTDASPSGLFQQFQMAGGSDIYDVDVMGKVYLTGIANIANSKAIIFSATAPTISSGFGSSPSIPTQNGTAAFTINVGAGGTASSGVIALPTAANGWNCFANDLSTTSSTVFMTKQTASSATTATIGNFNSLGAAAAWAVSDILSVSCFAR